jgi:peroxygenase
VKLRLAALSLLFVLSGCGQSPTATGDARVAGAAAAAGKAETSLMRHVRYFDKNGDGVIKPAETVQGAKGLGVNAVVAHGLALGLHASLGPKTSGKMSTEIRIENIHMGVHAGSINFDEKGHFKPAQFEAMFAEYDTNRSGALSRSEVFAMLKARKQSAMSYNLAKTAFTVLLAVASDTDEAAGKKTEPALSKARMQGFYDGSLFYTVAKERTQKKTEAAPIELDGAGLHAPEGATER